MPSRGNKVSAAGMWGRYERCVVEYSSASGIQWNSGHQTVSIMDHSDHLYRLLTYTRIEQQL